MCVRYVMLQGHDGEEKKMEVGGNEIGGITDRREK